MTFHLTILYSFLSIITVAIFSAYLLKIYRKRKGKGRVPEPQGAKKIDIELKGDIFELGKLAIILDDLDADCISCGNCLKNTCRTGLHESGMDGAASTQTVGPFYSLTIFFTTVLPL